MKNAHLSKLYNNCINAGNIEHVYYSVVIINPDCILTSTGKLWKICCAHTRPSELSLYY